MSTFVPTPKFPGGIPTDFDIPLAFPDASTVLQTGINASALTMTVTDGAEFPLSGTQQSTVIRIGEEQIKIHQRSGNVLTVAPGGRGFNGTVAASHNTGDAVRGVVSSYGWNRMREEVQAIAAASVDVRAFNFILTAVTDFTGFNASAGAQTITFTAPNLSPLGVAGNNTKHYIRITNGVLSEVALITGGTATSGATGTLQFTTVNSYSGTVQIMSASAGIQEAVKYSSHVRLPAGSYLIYATVSLPYKVSLMGAGQGSTELFPQTSSLKIFANIEQTSPTTSHQWTIADMTFNGRAFATNTLRGIELVNTWLTGGVDYLTNNCVTFRNLTFNNVLHGVYCDRVLNVRLIDIEAVDNTMLYFAETTGTSRNHGVQIRGYTHHPQVAPTPGIAAGLVPGDALIFLTRAHECIVDAAQIMGYPCDAITIMHGSHNCTIANCAIRACNSGIRLDGSGGAQVPHSARLLNNRIDASTGSGTASIHVLQGNDTLISGNSITQNDGNAFPNTYGIRLAAAPRGTVILGNIFQRFYLSSPLVTDDSANSFAIIGNWFRCDQTTADIVLGASNNRYTIALNQFASTNPSNPHINDNAYLGQYHMTWGNIGPPQRHDYPTGETHFGTPSDAIALTWDVHTSNNVHGANAGDFGFNFSGGTATAYKGRLNLFGGIVDMTNCSDLLCPPRLRIPSATFANLPTSPAVGQMVWCSDGTIATPVAGGGSGCLAIYNGTQWVGK